MKKFFHRFSSAAGEKNAVDTVPRPYGSEASIREKDHVQGLAGNKEKVTSGERVRALAARFETLSYSESKQQQQGQQRHQHQLQRQQSSPHDYLQQSPIPAPLISPTRTSDSATDTTDRNNKVVPSPPTAYLETRAANIGPVSTQRFSLPVAPVASRRDSSDYRGSAQLHAPSEFPRSTKMSREVSGASGSSNSSGGHSSQHYHQQQQHKTVAFAPSPKKPKRPSSPAVRPSSEGSQLELQPTSSSLSVGNFARATAASTARARSAAKAGTSELGPSSSGTGITTPFSGSTPSRPSSAAGSGRIVGRRSSTSATPIRRVSGTPFTQSETGHLTGSLSSVAMSQSAPFGGLSSGGVGSGTMHLPNSIPFVSHPMGSATLRSASPQSIGTTSSRPMQYHPMSGASSRRESYAGRFNSAGSNSQAWASSGAKSIGGPSWSEMTQDDLVSNLGARERIRQEVLWEIVASEERYARDLERTKDLYCDALLHTLRPAPERPSTTVVDGPSGRQRRASASLEERGGLPIAARFMTTESFTGALSASVASVNKDASDVTRSRATRQESKAEPMQSPSQQTSHQPSKEQKQTKSANPKRWSNSGSSSSKSGFASSQYGYGTGNGLAASVPLPPSLRITLEAISSGLLEGHLLLSEALKRRYEEQWPLVRSLADVFSKNAAVYQVYETYVLHLERALDCLEEAALMERAMRGKRIKKEKLPASVGLGRAIASLEAAAVERGECSLAIFLAMPFQRLLKYPLLFQNLLFHTDASTYEFESTVKMVVDVEHIVRSIEDEKADKEERDKTIDAFARIEGIKDRALLRPKKDRILIEEKAMYEENPRRAVSDTVEGGVGGSGGNNGSSAMDKGLVGSGLSSHNAASSGSLRNALKSKRSYRRLSDFLTNDDRQNQATKAPNIGSKKDLWLLRFSDVELKCQRVGVTALPLVSSTVLQQTREDGDKQMNDEAITMTEEEARIKEDFRRTKESRERMKALRNTTLRSKTRNLYKFVSVTSWKQVHKEKAAIELSHIGELISPQEVDEEDMEESEDEDEEVDDNDGDDKSSSSQETDAGVLDSERYIRQSKLSFSYWGHDKVEPKPLPIARTQSQSQQHSSTVAAFRSRPGSQQLKRHSLTPTGSVPPPPAMTSVASTRAVASNSHAKAKADKFANRTRQVIGPGVSLNSQALHPSSNTRLSHASRTGGANGSADVLDPPRSLDHDDGIGEQDDASQRLVATTASLPSKPSMTRDISIDSNLKSMSSLITDGRESQQGWL